MTALIILAFISLAGIGAAFWLLKSDKEPEEGSLSDALSLAEETDPSTPEEAPEPASGKKQRLGLVMTLLKKLKKKDADTTQPPVNTQTDEPTVIASKIKAPLEALSGILKKLPIENILKKLNIGEKDDPEPEPELGDGSDATPLSRLKEHFQKQPEDIPADDPETGTASIKTVPADEPVEEKPLPEPQVEEKKDEGTPMPSSELSELQGKYEKLDALFKEKSTELQKTQESLENEVQNRKEFSTVKDLLEKELKDSKDRTRDIKVEGENTKSEIERHQKRAALLEEKMALLEKDLVEKDDKINDLVKCLQTEEPPESQEAAPALGEANVPEAIFASPATAATPPVMEEPKKEEEVAPAMPEETPPPDEKPIEPEVPEMPAEEEAPSVEVPSENENTPQVSNSFEAEPPEPYEEPSEDAEPEEAEGGFLKLQPDIVSAEPEESISIANEIEQSLGSPPKREIKMDPGSPASSDPEAIPDQPAAPDTRQENEQPPEPSVDEETIQIVDPKEQESTPEDQDENLRNNNDNVKE